MTYDLRNEAWIPWRRRDGTEEWGPPALLLDDLSGNPVVAFASPRPDFDGALHEFLIGLLAAALQPADDPAWEELMEVPPEPGVLQDALDRLPPAFDLDGEGPRFFQDLSEHEAAAWKHWTAESLFIGMPNTSFADAQKRELIRDLFVKPGQFERLGRPVAAMALLTMQTYAPAGGKGHRTSLRGGGPLTTLVDPRVDSRGESRAHEKPLWHKLWANVETLVDLEERTVLGVPTAMEAAFPWLVPTRTSDPNAGGRETLPASAHPLETYFGLPRRIRLEFDGPGRCDVTGKEDEQTVTGFRMRNYGAMYVGWQHPLTPHYRTKPTESWLPMHGQPAGIGWRDWVGLTLQPSEEALRKPAATVVSFTRRVGRQAGKEARLHVFGYDMANDKARGWSEATMPIFVVTAQERWKLLRETGVQLADATGLSAAALLGAVKAARYENPKAASGDIGQVRGELWDSTESAFYGAMAQLADMALDAEAAGRLADQLLLAFQNVLRDKALTIFDRWCPTPGISAEPLRRRVVARHDLTSALTGYSKMGEKIFSALGVPLPGGGRAARAARKRTRTEANT